MSLDLIDLLNTLIMGLLLGGLYALIAIGLSLVFGVMKLLNVAHGDLVLLGSYLAYAAMTILKIDPILSLIGGIPIMFCVGFLIQKFLMGPASETSMEAPLLIAFGISLIFQNMQQLIWTPMSKGLTTDYILTSFSVWELYFPLSYVLDFFASLVLIALLGLFLKKTFIGKAIQGATQEKRAAQLVGINTKTINAVAFGIAMITAAVAGVFLGLTYPFTPQSGISFLIIAFGVVIIGGLGSILGTLLGGMVMGLAQTLGGYFWGSTAQMLVVYLVVLVVLSIRPQGFFGK